MRGIYRCGCGLEPTVHCRGSRLHGVRVLPASEVHDHDIPEVILAEHARCSGRPLCASSALGAWFTPLEHNLGHDHSAPLCHTDWRNHQRPLAKPSPLHAAPLTSHSATPWAWLLEGVRALDTLSTRNTEQALAALPRAEPGGRDLVPAAPSSRPVRRSGHGYRRYSPAQASGRCTTRAATSSSSFPPL